MLCLERFFMMLRFSSILFVLATSVLAQIGPDIRFDPSQDSASWVSGTGKSTWSFFGDAKVSQSSLETRTGGLRIPGYAQPKGAFSVEAIFRADSTGSPQWNHLSDLVNSATWPISGVYAPEQGFAFRTGGGLWYPEMGAGAPLSEWSRRLSLNTFDVQNSSKLSRCLLDFSMAPTSQKVWFEVFSDRCVETGKWHHAVATWDGQNQAIYLDGENVTDPWRIHAPIDVPRLDSNVILNIGARAYASLDFRYLRGGIRKANILSGALSAEEVLYRYQAANQRPESGVCAAQYRITSPLSLQVLSREDSIQIRKRPGSLCSGSAFDTNWQASDSLEIELLDSNARTLEIVKTYAAKTAINRFTLLSTYEGAVQFRIRPKASASGALARAAAQPNNWSNGLPAVIAPRTSSIRSRSTALRHRSLASGRHLIGTTQPLQVLALDGRELSAKIVATDAGQEIELSKADPGLVLIKSKQGSLILINP
ncbi:MAG: Concanavalin A-like lectin/glucanase superfamily [Fibrobacterota bacterium]|jgi:hypothetical protein